MAWRFNLDVIAKHIEIVGEATPDSPSVICKIPVCFVKGEKSDYIKKEDEQLIANQYANSEVITISNAGHWVHAENPMATLKAMTNFFIK